MTKQPNIENSYRGLAPVPHQDEHERASRRNKHQHQNPTGRGRR